MRRRADRKWFILQLILRQQVDRKLKKTPEVNLRVRVCVCRHLKSDHHDQMEESVLVIRNFQRADLRREFNCSVRNGMGFYTLRAELHEEGERDRKSLHPLPVLP